MFNILNYTNFHDTISFIFISLAFFIPIVLTFFYLLNFSYLPNQLPLFYSLSWGQSQLVTKQQFLVLPLITVLITIVNLIVLWHLHPSQIILRRMVCLASLLCAILVFITGVKIINIFI